MVKTHGFPVDFPQQTNPLTEGIHASTWGPAPIGPWCIPRHPCATAVAGMFVLERVNGKHGGKMGGKLGFPTMRRKKTWKTQRDNQVVFCFSSSIYELKTKSVVWNHQGIIVCIMSSGWWWLEHEFYDFPFSWECHNPNWRTHIFHIIYIYIYIHNPIIPHFLIDLRLWTSIYPPWIPADSSFHQPY